MKSDYWKYGSIFVMEFLFGWNEGGDIFRLFLKAEESKPWYHQLSVGSEINDQLFSC